MLVADVSKGHAVIPTPNPIDHAQVSQGIRPLWGYVRSFLQRQCTQASKWWFEIFTRQAYVRASLTASKDETVNTDLPCSSDMGRSVDYMTITDLLWAGPVHYMHTIACQGALMANFNQSCLPDRRHLQPSQHWGLLPKYHVGPSDPNASTELSLQICCHHSRYKDPISVSPHQIFQLRLPFESHLFHDDQTFIISRRSA